MMNRQSHKRRAMRLAAIDRRDQLRRLSSVRILQLNSARTFGGGERHFADLVNALAARGHEVYAALAPASPLRAELNQLPPANISTLPLRNALDVPSALALARHVRAHRIEIIHAHVARDYPLAALAARRASGARLVITRHVPFPVSRLHRLVLANVARVIAVSAPVAQGLRAQKIFRADKIRVVANGIDLARCASVAPAEARAEWRRRLHVPAAVLLVGTVGDLSPVKGQDVFVRAAAQVCERGLKDVVFLIVGEDRSTNGRMRAQVEQLIATHGLAGRVRLLGRIDELAPFLAALDVYVSASRAEAFGLALVEAMACSVPVVASATDGSRDIIEDGTTGQLVPVGAPEALADALVTLLDDADARATLGAQARTAAHTRFSLERMIDETEQVYREMMNAE
jgi:L-malate glycosyltransferase